MRRILLSLAVLGGVMGAGAAVRAAPVAIAPVMDRSAQVQTVQWGPDYWRWQRHEHWRHRRWEAWRRHEAWRHWRHHHRWAYGW